MFLALVIFGSILFYGIGATTFYCMMWKIHGEPNNYAKGWFDDFDRKAMVIFWFITIGPCLVGEIIKRHFEGAKVSKRDWIREPTKASGWIISD